jgi:hypothetical protein
MEPAHLWRLCPQVPISFKDLAVRFTEEEWRLLQEGQREFYRDVMRENYETLVSVGKGPRPPGVQEAVEGQGRGGGKLEPTGLLRFHVTPGHRVLVFSSV